MRVNYVKGERQGKSNVYLIVFDTMIHRDNEKREILF